MGRHSNPRQTPTLKPISTRPQSKSRRAGRHFWDCPSATACRPDSGQSKIEHELIAFGRTRHTMGAGGRCSFGGEDVRGSIHPALNHSPVVAPDSHNPNRTPDSHCAGSAANDVGRVRRNHIRPTIDVPGKPSTGSEPYCEG